MIKYKTSITVLSESTKHYCVRVLFLLSLDLDPVQTTEPSQGSQDRVVALQKVYNRKDVPSHKE